MLLIMAVAVSGLFIGGGQTSQASSSDRSSDSSSSKEKEAAKSLAAPEVSTAVRFDVSPPLGELMRQNPAPDKSGGPEVEMPDFYGGKVPADNGFSGDGAVQKFLGAMAIPTPFVAFDGILNQWSVHPPDPNGDVGPNHYVQMVNLGFRIFDKLGNPLTPVANNNTLWSGFGGPCEVENAGDPIVLHDQLADRWMLTQFSDSGAPFFNCVALSTTADPTGTYYRYAFSAPAFPDYPKYGVWPDAYYLNAREGDTTLGNYALEREQMLVGNPAARVVRFGSGPGYASGNGLLPSDLDGEDLPPAGSPNYFIGTQDDDGAYGAPLDAINIYEFHVDWANTANSTFTGPTTLPVEEFDSNYPCSGRQCIPQPGTTVRVDILSYRQRPTWRAAYRNFGTHESIVTAQSVEAAPAHAGMRWYELRGLAGTPVVYQQGTYSPDTIIHRWMGSIAMDGSGNMALGYSVSNGVDVYPGLRFTGRLASDPLGTMPQGEGIMKVGTGSQTSTGARWGDYTSMTVDPSDDCSFWYTNQFIPTTSSVGWRGAVGAFKFPGCTGSGGTPTPTVTGTPPTATRTPTRTNTPTATNTIQVPANCNPTLITIPDSGPGVPYPSLVNFSGGTSVTDVNVTLNDVTHSYPDDVDILLVGPAGQSVILMSDAGGSNDVTDVDLTFDDEATATLPDSAQIVAGSYDPTNYLTGDTFPAPAPGGPYGTTMSVFDGTNPNGNWSLYVVDDLGGDMGDIGGGWCVDIQTGPSVTPSPTVCGGNPSWTNGPAYTPGVYAVQGGVSSSNGNFYIAGGQDAANVSLPNVNRFNPATNTFTALAPLPVAVGQGAVGVTASKMYVAGGYVSGTTITSTLQIYDIATNTWSFGAPMPAAKEAAAGVIYNNKFYVMGGDDFNAVVATNYIYDIATNTWTTGAALPAGRSNLNGTTVGNYIYTAGGVTGAGFDANDALLRYDPAANSWTALAPFGVAGYGNYAGISPYGADKLFVLVGGNTGFDPIDTTRIYDIGTNTWTNGPTQLVPRMAHAQGTLQDGRIIVVSGYDGTGTYTTSNLLTPGGPCATATTGPSLTPTRTATTGTPVTATPTSCVVQNVIVDGSFEGGSPNAAWDEGSTNFGTPLCDAASCGTGGGTAGPRTGAWWAWFGGIQAVEDAFVSQSVNIPTGAQATLQFYLWIGAHSGGGTADYVRVLVGGTEVFRATDADTQYDAGYTLVTVNVSAQAGGQRIVRIESHNGDVGVFNANVDDVSLNVGGCPSPTVGPSSTATSPPPTVTTPPATNTPGPPCTLQFADVPPTNTFYPFVRCLACQGIINGYPCGGDFEPCNANNDPYFRPNNYVTRGQIAKIVSISAGFNEPVPSTQQSFEDVVYGSPFWEYVERLYARSIIGGYQCGVDPNEPCVPPDNLPYFRPNNGATRGQLTKIVSEAAGFTDIIPQTQYTFADVQPNSTFWIYVERLLLNRPGVMSGYVCGSVPSEPCDAENRPYFRPNNPLTRGQTSKIVANTFFPGCNPPRP
jgi:subtilisin-like proprotein convertase family protein